MRGSSQVFTRHKQLGPQARNGIRYSAALDRKTGFPQTATLGVTVHDPVKPPRGGSGGPGRLE